MARGHRHVAEHLVVGAVLLDYQDDVLEARPERIGSVLDCGVHAVEMIIAPDLRRVARKGLRVRHFDHAQAAHNGVDAMPDEVLAEDGAARPGLGSGRAGSCALPRNDRTERTYPLTVGDVERLRVFAERYAQGKPCSRDQTRDFGLGRIAARRRVQRDDLYGVIAAQAHVESLAVRGDRQAVGTARCELARGRAGGDRLHDGIVVRADHGDRVGVGVGYEEARSIGRKGQIGRLQPDGNRLRSRVRRVVRELGRADDGQRACRCLVGFRIDHDGIGGVLGVALFGHLAASIGDVDLIAGRADDHALR